MRQIILDTETTGLETEYGHRIVEIGAVEMVNRQLTDRTFHLYVDPEREVDAEATKVHGMTRDKLRGKPKFRDVAAQFVDFAQDAEWVIHNAPFDLGFLDMELRAAGQPGCANIYAGVIDTIVMARDLYPGRRSSLTALCDRLEVDDSHRTFHGALLDAQLLARVYLAMTRGQESFFGESDEGTSKLVYVELPAGHVRQPLPVLQPTEDELAAHRAYLADIEKESKGNCLWLALERETAAVPRLAQQQPSG